MRRRRYIESGVLYEVTCRAQEGLPFAFRSLITLILKSSIARTQKDFKVHLSHFLWMSNHVHLLIISKDATEMTRFYGEVQKRITDAMKRLLGLGKLDLWEGAPSVIKIADYEAAQDRIAYFYANPARAHLVDSITKYPGYSSYSEFISASNKVTFRASERAHWIRCPTITKLPCRTLSDTQDKFLVEQLKGLNKKTHALQICPNLWMSCFGITERDEVARANKAIQRKIEILENAAREDRQAKGIKVLGVKALKEQPIMLAHTPKKYSRRIFVISRSKEIRIEFIKKVNAICKLCAECYRRWKRGDYAFVWPPGTFPPPLPLTANVLRSKLSY